MSENVTFSAKQIKAIEWLAASKYERTPATQVLLAEQIGVHDKTISRWKKDPDFREAITARARELLGENLSEIYAALNREAEKGSFQHIKLAMEMTGEYTPKQEVSGEINIKGYEKVSPDDWD
jgi:hypothetical protein